MKNHENRRGKNIEAANRGEDAAEFGDNGNEFCNTKSNAAKPTHGEDAAPLGSSKTEKGIKVSAASVGAGAQLALRQNYEQLTPFELLLKEAGALISENPDFRLLIRIPISAAERGESASFTYLDEIHGESQKMAVRRMTEIFYRKYPVIGIFSHLNLISVRLTALGYFDTVAKWHFKEDCWLTEKGRECWRRSDSEIDPLALPLAARELLAVTDFSPENKDYATANIAWRLAPNGLGKILDKNAKIFARLPADLRAQYIESGIAEQFRADYARIYGGTADFVLGGAGWHLQDLRLDPVGYRYTNQNSALG